MAPSILLIGASGLLGKPVVEELLAQKERFDRIGILADPSRKGKFASYESQGVDLVVGSYLDSRLYSGFDTVISLVGNALMKLQPGIIEAAIAGGITHFYPSEYGADLSNPQAANIRYFRDKYATREHLADKAKEVPGFKYTLLLVGSFTEFAASSFFGVDTEKHTVEAYGKPDAIVSNTAQKE
jgi:uncharacterized protein YbjT (DUF2867 family)